MQENQHINDAEDLSNPFSFLTPLQFEERKGKQMEYRLSDSYFEDLDSRIMERIEYMETTPAFSKALNEPQSVPSGYFENLGIEIETAIRLEKLGLSREEPFTVPADYFDWLPSLVQDRVSGSSRIRFSLSSLKALLSPRYWITGMVAAVVIILVGIHVFDSSPPAQHSAEAVALNENDRKELLENLEFYGFDESIVSDHIASKIKTAETAEASPDKKAEIDYLIENNADLNTIVTE
jgi:hypothetical protein